MRRLVAVAVALIAIVTVATAAAAMVLVLLLGSAALAGRGSDAIVVGSKNFTEQLILGDPRISILEGVIIPWGEPSGYLRKIVLPALAHCEKAYPHMENEYGLVCSFNPTFPVARSRRGWIRTTPWCPVSCSSPMT